MLLPTPWYFNHQMSLAMLGIEPRALPCRPEAGFVPALADAEALIDGRVRAIVLVTPEQSDRGGLSGRRDRGVRGALPPARHFSRHRRDLPRFPAAPARNRPHGLFAAPAGAPTSSSSIPSRRAYAIPGHRTGAVVADARLIGEIAKVLDCLQICAPRAAQAALPWAIEALAGWREANRAEINRRAEAFRAALAPLPGWRVDSVGAYFAYLRHPFRGGPRGRSPRGWPWSAASSRLPGSYFGPGQEGHLRVAFANVGAEVLAGLGERLRGF